jgi:Tol biopolymer transport system component/DNA-binding winged helix-turn-helix (wHTH) protein
MQKMSDNQICGYRFDDVIVDLTDFRLQKSGEAQKITPRSFEVLVYLVRNVGRLVEKQELFAAIWGETFVSDNALTRVVREIRQVIGDDALSPRYIETVPKHGYRFIAEVETLKSPGRDEVSAENFAKEPQPSSPQKNRNFRYYGLAAVLLAAFAATWFYLRNDQKTDFPASAVRTAQLTNWSGLDNFPAISPDGNSIAYSSDRTGSFEIFIKPLVPGAREIQITSDGEQNFQPVFSPDGQRIAFHSKGRRGIWIIPSSGGTAKQLTEFGSHPAFSPDGQRIAFQSDGLTDLGINARTLPPSVLWLVSPDGGPPRQLTQNGKPAGGHGSPAWSPDGQRIAFNLSDMTTTQLWSIELGNGRLQEINAQSSDPVYAPDGKSIYAVSINGLWQIPVSPVDGKVTGEPKKIVDDGPGQIRNPSISANGGKIVYEMLLGTSRISALSLDKTGVPEILTLLQNTSTRNAFPVFSPDGRRIAYSSGRTGAPSELWVMNSEGRDSVQAAGNMLIANWLSDSDTVAFISLRERATRLLSVNLTDGKETQLFTFKNVIEYARLSPDGRKIAFNSKENGTINIELIDLQSKEQKQLTSDPELAGFPIWSPDGKWIAFQIKRGDDTHVALIPADGGKIQQLTNEPGQSWIHSFSPDGSQIVFAGQRQDVWNIYTVSRVTGEQKKLTNFTQLNTYVRYPAWSPRNDKIVFEYAETQGNIWLTELK